MENPVEKYLFTLRFFTRLPIPEAKGSDGNLAGAALAFPFAGLSVGLLCALVWWLATALVPPLPAAGVTLLFGILITGALHEDGFSDCADGLGGGFTRERALEIMRDSRIGAYGACALVFTVGLRWSGLASFSPIAGVLALLLALGRARAVVWALHGLVQPLLQQ